eukprot:1049699-Pleurochrysis_carterae.AAC.1
MAAWKANAALRKERDQLATQVRSSSRRLERAEVVSSRALDWHDEADSAAAAVSQQRNRTMGMYRATVKDLEEEQLLKAEIGEECKQLRADLAK